MTKIGSKNMVFKTEEEEHDERPSCKLTVDKGIELFLAAKSKNGNRPQRLSINSA